MSRWLCFFRINKKQQKVKELFSSFVDMNINKTKLYENFINFKNIANLKILRCLEKLFSKKGLYKNIGNYILIFLITFHIISIFIFYFKQFIIIENKIKDITNAINHLESRKQEKEKEGGENIINKNIIENNSKENKFIFSTNKKKNQKKIKRNTTVKNIITNIIENDNISKKNKENKDFAKKEEKLNITKEYKK